MNGEKYVLVFSPIFEQAVRRLKKKKPDLVRELVSRFPKLARTPELGKPLKNVLRTYRRIHIEGSFVLLYEIQGSVVRLLDFDHHNKIYKKYS